RLLDAAFQYMHVLSVHGGDLRLRRRVLELVGGMSLKVLSKHDLDLLKRRFEDDRTTEAVTLGQAFYLLQGGDTTEGMRRIQDFIKRYPSSSLKPDAFAVLEPKPSPPSVVEVVSQPKPSVLKIGLLCPLTGEDREFGEELQRGAQIALDQSGRTLSLVVEDVGSGSIHAVKAAQKLIEQDRVVALVGPISSGLTIGVAAVANASRVPLIAPTASEDGIASIGPYIFQLNPTPGIQGKRIGEYAVGSLAMKTCALIASLDSYGKSMADSFAAAVERSRGKIIRREWYVPGTTTDFTKQLLRIRDAASMRASQPEAPVASSPIFDDTTGVTSLDGLLIAGWPEDIITIAPQVVFHKIKTVLLGGNGWNSSDVVHRGGTAVEGAFFAAGDVEGQELPMLQTFESVFRARFQKEGGRVAALGYDAVTLLANAVKADHRTADTLRDYLVRVNDFSGASGTITLSKGRVNSHTYILKIEDGRIIRVE
ncbi:MAG: ABC transporter substrate-binding protein, partial [Candidatus Latescibacteria bacterium]|nr:ABC transporter substrate-binding protein [Candidatus Latescibacterota bacterium]